MAKGVKLPFLHHIDSLPELAEIEVEGTTYLAAHTVIAVVEHHFEAVSIVAGPENEIEQMQHGVEVLLTTKNGHLQKGEVDDPPEVVDELE